MKFSFNFLNLNSYFFFDIKNKVSDEIEIICLDEADELLTPNFIVSKICLHI